MKKIVSVMTIAAMATAMFAADPTFSPAVTEYTGEASISYKVDLDGVNLGMENADSASLKYNLWSAGSKATTGDGLWGELAISNGAPDAATEKWIDPKQPAVDKALIHFVDGDFYVHMNIKAPSLKVGGIEYPEAVAGPLKQDGVEVALADKAGFSINTGLDKVVDVTIGFADNGVKAASAKKFAASAEASLKAVENLDAYAGVAWSQEEKDVAVAAKAAYKAALSDKLFVQPAVGFTMKGAKNLAAGVLFGWGATGVEANFAKFNGAVENVQNKNSEGVSVTVKTGDFSNFDVVAGVYDQSLVEGLKMGAEMATTANFKTIVVDAAAAYGTKLDIWNLAANVGAKFDVKDSKFGILYGASVDTDGIIQNTNLKVGYTGEQSEKIAGGKNTNGTITMTAKIHF